MWSGSVFWHVFFLYFRDDFDNPGYDNVSLSSLKPIESDEDSMGEYGEIDIAKFNEDGSFIGLYAEKKKPTQSTV